MKVTHGFMALALVALTTTSCKEKKQEQEGHDDHQSEHMEGADHMDDMEQQAGMDDAEGNHGAMAMMSSEIVADYLALKDALVSDDQDGAARAGTKLEGSLKNFNTGHFAGKQQGELNDIIEDATEHAGHIGRSEIDHQREHFDVLSKDMIDLLTITGSSQTLYQTYCPMYNNNKGGQWLSASKDIKNPYFGSKMLTCGTVQQEIN